ncbi:MAG TPA: cytochrome c biogenesis protein CcsA [Ignavibacteriaceae bacterium]|jgi:ABC-type transport system involved in cytochrome c biogenesis permease subunit|nr:cytochrome c biogenesis protein CcsA [Ignavibacteriaceae bacterium]HOJ18845.1 cytochrome c biogenesis protein CcsA [Ignavibacteriaceae bacterium]
MSATIHFFNFMLPILYAGTFGIYLYDFVKSNRRLANAKRLIIFLTLMFHLLYLIIRTFAFNHPPITNVFEIFTVLAFSIGFSYFVLELATDIRGTGPFIIIIAFVFQLVSTLFIKDLVEVQEILRSNLLGVHVLSALCGYAGITISAVYGFLYLSLYKEIKENKYGLIFQRLPNLEILEKLSFYSAVIGFTGLTIAIIIGLIWLPSAFPDFSYYDPKLISTAIVWLLYGVGIVLKLHGQWSGRKVISLSVIGFILAMISVIAINFIARSFHAFS